MLLKYSSERGKPSICYALAVMALQFFASSLITLHVLDYLDHKFNHRTVLVDFLVASYKQILTLFSAPLIGALSDIWGRKLFLFITVFFSCAPLLFMTINTWLCVVVVTISGIFDVTFSLIHAYIADVTTTESRSLAFGFVSAAITITMVIVKPLYYFSTTAYGYYLIVAVSTIIAVLNAILTYFVVPESLPADRPSSCGTSSSWKHIHPFAAIRKVGLDHTILMQCGVLLLSFISEARRMSYFGVYMSSIKRVSDMELILFIAGMEITSILAQLALGVFMRVIGAKSTIILGLVFQAIHLLIGLGTQPWMIWTAAILAALSSITYPAILASVSINTHADAQGVVLGILSGIHGLWYVISPFMFHLLHTLLQEEDALLRYESTMRWTTAVGAFMAVIAILVQVFIPTKPKLVRISEPSSEVQYQTLGEQEAQTTTPSPYVQ